MSDLHTILSWLEYQDYWGNSASSWLKGLLVALAVAIGLRVILALLARHASRLVERGARDWARAIEKLVQRTKGWFLLTVAIYCGIYVFFMPGPKSVPAVVDWIGVIALWCQAALWANAMLSFMVAHYAQKNKGVDAAGVTMVSTLGSLGKAAVWVVAVLMALVSMKIEITPLIAGLGIGGIAVALAAQNILADLFASVSIILDKPFVLGDFIIVDDKMGSVEHIGLKTTHLRSLSGEQLIFSNTDLLKSRIHNYKRMSERRIVFSIGVTYDTPYEKVEAISTMLREIIQSQQSTRFDRAHFARYGDSALNYEVVYYVLAADYGTFMDVQQAVNLAIYRRFAEEKIEFAFPTQTIYLHK